MKKEVTLAKALALPINLAKKIIEKDLLASEALRTVDKEGLLDEYKGPWFSNVKASCVLNDTITVDFYEENNQNDGTYLITYVRKYIEEYKLLLYVRVLTSGLKKKIKYHKYNTGAKLKIKGDLDMYVTDNMCFDSDGDYTPDKTANVAVVITVIDIL